MHYNYNDIAVYFNNRETDFIGLLEKLVSFRTYSGQIEEINRFLDFLEQLFSEFSPITCRRSTAKGDILCLTFAGAAARSPGEPFVVLLAHSDTVKVGEPPAAVRTADKRFYANGSYDMKSGIALFYFALKAHKHFGLRSDKSIKIIFTPDEETGSAASLPILLEECRGADAVILPEPCCSDGGVKTRRKGIASIHAALTGKAAHSGIEPGKGIDANRALAKLIDKIEQITGKIGRVSFNPGVISGGTAVNVISPNACLEFELRSYDNTLLEKALLEITGIKNIAGAACAVSTRDKRPALEFDDKNKKLYEIARKIALALNYDLPAGESGGGSDGSFLSAAGIPVIDGIGLKGGGAHASEEYIEITDFPFRATLVGALCLEV